MARISRMCYESSFFHIMVQGINKEYIFQKDEYKEKYLEFLLDSVKANGVDIISYCIMDNHVHSILFTPIIQDLSKVMASTNTKYAKFYNKELNRCGFVFRDRYRCESIMNQGHLDNCIRYIHNNPVEANICGNPSDYKYSSYNDYKNRLIDEKIIKLIAWDINDYSDRLNYGIQDYDFIDVNNEFWQKKFEDINQVLSEHPGINNYDDEEIFKIICEIKKRCNIFNMEIAKALDMNKSAYYRLLKKFKEK